VSRVLNTPNETKPPDVTLNVSALLRSASGVTADATC